MTTTPDPAAPPVAVLGAGGRVGRAVTAALLRQDHSVTAVLRDPDRHELPPHPRLRVVKGDAQQPERLSPILGSVGAVVLAVTPFTAPPPSFDGFDLDYYARIVTALDGAWTGPHRRLVAVGLTATLRLATGDAVMDDPDLFPARLRPFAEAHARQLSAVRATTLDWAILTPTADFGSHPGLAARQRYRLVREPLDRRQATARLSHATYARAVVAETGAPTVRAQRVAVVPVTEE
ncbi:NAD(P)-dependent oxidoreductase [Micromonospora costi]|uniref:NAD-dependent epimerase/dehydratase family protein n=1 Tax=Micromonospora costi TaxID=1530042 RepID=A0A3A9ZV69_9ACTN|nr:NAD(P)H-binding protein [Micromonospora costi]RKN52071.1 NAD-dependent epimerase/dehydratase family protein [Micromonospora costi]